MSKRAQATMSRRWREWQRRNAKAVSRMNPQGAALAGFQAGWRAAFKTVLDLRLEAAHKGPGIGT